MTRSLRLVRRTLPLALLLGALGCSGGLNCGSGCAQDYAYPQTTTSVPNGTRAVDDGIRLRLTQQGLDFIVANLRPVLATAFGGEQNGQFRVVLPPGQLAGATVEYGRASTDPFEEYPATVIVDAEALGNNIEVELVDASNAIRVVFEDIPIGVDMRLFSDWGIGNAACNLTGTSPDYGGAPYLTGLTLEALVRPRVGSGAECDEAGGVGECIKVDVDIVRADVDPRGNLGSEDIELDTPPSCPTSCPFIGSCSVTPDGPGGCSEACTDTAISPGDTDGNFECLGVCTVADVGIDVVFEIVGVIEPLLGGLLDNALQAAVTNALEDVDGAPLSISSRQDIAAAVPGVLPASALDLGFAIAPTTGAFDVNAPAGGSLGVDLVLKSGFEAAPPLDDSEGLTVPHPCVRPIEGVTFADLYGDGVRGEFAVPDNLLQPLTGSYDGRPYHLGASLAKPAVNQILFALYNTGSLCLEIDSDAINRLTDGAFQLSAATLDLLTSGKLKQFADADAPAILAVNPSQPPVVRYGAGTAEEGHMIIEWPDVEVGFYVLMFERFSRIFAVQADISMQVAVFNDPGTGTLRISVVDGPNVTGFEETYNELLPGVDFTEVLEQLLGVAFDAALGDGLEFPFDIGNALSGALGVPLFIDFRGIETVPANDREFLNVYLAMTDTPPQPRTVAPTYVGLAREPGVLRMVDAEQLGRGQRALPTGEVHVTVGDGDAREWFARVDFGAWRGPLRATNDVVVVRDAKLRAAGEHTITLRSRLRGDVNSLEDVGQSVAVWVDAVDPTVTLSRRGDALVAAGSDDATPAHGLVYAWQLDDGAWSAFTTSSALPLDGLQARRVAVKVQDLAGNVSRAVGVDVGVEQRRLRADREAEAAMSMGCTQASPTAIAPFAAALLGLLFAGRRRRR
jgi:MYXO-CTERM domain-containing protein